jgi:hypothetical protein
LQIVRFNIHLQRNFMKKNIIHGLIFGFIFAGSVNAMDPAQKKIDDEKKYTEYAREHLEARLNTLVYHKRRLATISEESQKWFDHCNNLKSEEETSMTNLHNCLNPMKKAVYDDAFVKQIVDNAVVADARIIEKEIAQIKDKINKQIEHVKSERIDIAKASFRTLAAAATHRSKATHHLSITFFRPK